MRRGPWQVLALVSVLALLRLAAAKVETAQEAGSNEIGHDTREAAEVRAPRISWKPETANAGRIVSPLETERAVTQVIEVHADLQSLQSVGDGVDLSLKMPMSSASGDAFVCFPSQEIRKAATGTRTNDTTTDGGEEDAGSSFKEIQANLESLRGKCVPKRAKYWTFVVCPFDRIEQNHYEHKTATISFHLGSYQAMERQTNKDGEADWVQHFSGGSDGRQTKLTIKCRRDVGADLVVDAISEPKTHMYEIVVFSTLACSSSVEWQAQQLLAPLQGECFQRAEGWWTYELCIGQYLRQFHQTKDGRSTEYVLGKFDEAANIELQDKEQVLVTDRHTNRPYFLQKYTGGTPCDLRSNERAAEIHFMCSSSEPISALPAAVSAAAIASSVTTSIISITESPTCFYVVKVQTPLVCSHPFFSDQESRARGILARLHCLPRDAFTEDA
ncbi:Protein OS-9-like [Hondaea fermentalgiana]|uniref:Protein OS-9-like n=1 Tax=Hondaea fermentalgiana TaxID=2315210 RepID=A0A2R5GQQ5_9STRA|nr:Protein OS-9-like [Hondaea fermentalgiana]|eukprot:GBG33180.1 Protein OS-9-like [Hondaea fermentalgiana]